MYFFLGLKAQKKRENPWKSKRTKGVNHFLGKKHTPETILLLSKYAQERLTDPKEGFKFIVTDTLTGTIEEFPSTPPINWGRKGVKAMGWDQGYITGELNRGLFLF